MGFFFYQNTKISLERKEAANSTPQRQEPLYCHCHIATAHYNLGRENT